MTEAEQELLDLVIHPDFGHCVARMQGHATKLLAARQKVVAERMPDSFTEELQQALIEKKAAEDRLAALGRQHPVACYGEEGLIVQLSKGLG